MNNKWRVHINNEGTLFISGKQKETNTINLFGAQEFEYGLCVYSHHLRPLRKLLNNLFPNVSIKNLDTIEELIREEFCNHRSVSAFQKFLDKAQIPYRSYSNVA